MPTFFIADDSPIKTGFLQHCLAAFGWSGEVLTARSTEEAKRVIDSTAAIDAAFIDYYIPSENGPAIISHLRTAFPSCQIALVTSSENPDCSTDAKAAGADACVDCVSEGERTQRAIEDLLLVWKVEREQGR
jgi:CheY-like chemotaxis protein